LVNCRTGNSHRGWHLFGRVSHDVPIYLFPDKSRKTCIRKYGPDQRSATFRVHNMIYLYGHGSRRCAKTVNDRFDFAVFRWRNTYCRGARARRNYLCLLSFAVRPRETDTRENTRENSSSPNTHYTLLRGISSLTSLCTAPNLS